MSNSVRYRFLSLAVIAVMSIALAACGGDSGSGGGGGTSMSNGDLLKKAAANMKSAKSYHIDMSGTASGQQITLAGDLDVANKNSTLAVTAAGQNVQVVSIGDTSYVSTDSGKTFINAGSAGASITSGMSQFTGVWNNFSDADVDKSASALKDGSPATDSIDGTSCHHITANASDLASLSAGSGAGAGGTVDLWAANDGSYICQVKVTTTDKSTDITIKWSKLNSIPAITAPPTSN